MQRSHDERYPLAPRAFDTFGARRQLLALAEEMNEAASAIVRLLNGKGDHIEIVEEVVDVESVTASLRDWLAEPAVWAQVRTRKRAKLEAVLNSGTARTRMFRCPCGNIEEPPAGADQTMCQGCGRVLGVPALG